MKMMIGQHVAHEDQENLAIKIDLVVTTSVEKITGIQVDQKRETTLVIEISLN